jgi:hypothetical protein
MPHEGTHRAMLGAGTKGLVGPSVGIDEPSLRLKVGAARRWWRWRNAFENEGYDKAFERILGAPRGMSLRNPRRPLPPKVSQAMSKATLDQGPPRWIQQPNRPGLWLSKGPLRKTVCAYKSLVSPCDSVYWIAGEMCVTVLIKEGTKIPIRERSLSLIP